ncbi:unnamed protein product [Blepharisma stoltei]|uniref:Uncharacterized protein n=1 Tax=Blepharisma stoltei TaxID=1481888 RepID=A0AAU9JXY8_9CILI|nr:unnamed protein product [Blepharisma stoltei]
MTSNFLTNYSRKSFSMMRSSSPMMQRHFSIGDPKRSPKARDSRHIRKVIMRKMEYNKESVLKIIDTHISQQTEDWHRKIQSTYKRPGLYNRKKIIVKNLDKISVKTKDILDVSIDEFDKKVKYTLSPSPMKSYSEKIFELNPEGSFKVDTISQSFTNDGEKHITASNRLRHVHSNRRTILDKISKPVI